MGGVVVVVVAAAAEAMVVLVAAVIRNIRSANFASHSRRRLYQNQAPGMQDNIIQTGDG